MIILLVIRRLLEVTLVTLSVVVDILVDTKLGITAKTKVILDIVALVAKILVVVILVDTKLGIVAVELTLRVPVMSNVVDG